MKCLQKGVDMDRPLILSVDFDGTLCESQWPNIGKPNMHLFAYLINCRKCGIKVILNTMREGKLLDDAVEFCKKLGLSFDAVNNNLPEMVEMYGQNSRKIGADFYIDDRSAIVRGLGRRLPDLKRYVKHGYDGNTL